MKLSVIATLAVLLWAAPRATAQDEPLRLMREPGAFTDVADAADGDDPYDLNIRAAFRRVRETATLQRQEASALVPGYRDVADWEHVRNLLELGVDFGIYKDIALYARLPLVLTDTRSLTATGTAASEAGFAGDSEALFPLPFESRERSGLENLTVGLAFSPTNQARHRWQPTWTVLLEGRFSIGDLIEPCAAGGDCGDGISDGTHSVAIENRLSRRYRYAEPYGGLAFRFAWAGRAKDRFAPGGELAGYVHRRPPMRGHLAVGVEIIPWEERMKFQRLSFDLRATGTYISEGRDYSLLYDALGTSSHSLLTSPNYEGVGAGFAFAEVPFNGLTDVQAHGEVTGTVAVQMRAARYVSFRFETNFTYVSPHFVTFTDACNSGAEANGADDPRVGACSNGLIDPHYRAVTDATGQRFRVDDVFRLGFNVNATVQF